MNPKKKRTYLSFSTVRTLIYITDYYNIAKAEGSTGEWTQHISSLLVSTNGGQTIWTLSDWCTLDVIQRCTYNISNC